MLDMWMARDVDGSLHFGTSKPVRGANRWIWHGRKYMIDREAPMFAGVTWEGGVKAASLSEAPGSCGRKRKVKMIGADGDVKEFESVSKAAKAVGVCVSEVTCMCQGRKYSFRRLGLKVRFEYI